jgi:hypothetical protein
MNISKKLILALLLTAFANITIQIFQVHKYTYDAYTHIFFADHYRRDWLSFWEPRWYGGFSVTTYPPLFHQLTALLSFSLGVEGAYQLMAVASTVFLTLSVYLFSRVLIGREEACWSALIAAVSPSVSLLLNAFGQITTLFSSALALLAAYAYSRYLRESSARRLASASLLTALSGAAHHFTFLFFVPATQLIVLMQHLNNKKVALARTLIHGILSIGLLLLMIWSFIEFTLSAPSWTEIPHGSRENILASMLSFPFFWGIYGFTAFLLPLAAAIAFRRRSMLPAFIVFLLFFILGLGGATPLPRLLLGRLWSILTYDRFAFWASLLYIPFLSILLNDVGVLIEKYCLGAKNVQRGYGAQKLLAVSFLAGLAAVYILIPVIVVCWVSPKGPLDDKQLRLVAGFLDSESEWMYVTLGLGNQRILLSAMTAAPTLDGGYNLAKSLALMAGSGVEGVDNAKYYAGGLDFLRRVLVEGSNRGLRFVVSADSFYDNVLIDFGLRPIKIIPGGHLVTIWEIPFAEHSSMISPDQNPIFQFLWGLAPLLMLFICVSLALPKAVRVLKS